MHGSPLWEKINTFFSNFETHVHWKSVHLYDTSINLFIGQMYAPKSHYAFRPYGNWGLLFQILIIA